MEAKCAPRETKHGCCPSVPLTSSSENKFQSKRAKYEENKCSSLKKLVVLVAETGCAFLSIASKITAVNSFHPALKYTWEISDTSLAFLDIKLSIEGNGLCTSVL